MSEDEEEEDMEELEILPPKVEAYKMESATAFRFLFIMNLTPTEDPKELLRQIIKLTNQILCLAQCHLQFHDVSGTIAIIPWEDTKVFSNHASKKIKQQMDFERQMALVRKLIFRLGSLQPKKKEMAGIK